MGVFDYVKFECDCPKCGEKVDDFQTKDGPCCMLTVEFYEVDNFYSYCPKCETWIDFTLYNRPNRKLTIKDYNMTVEEMKNIEVKDEE